MTDSEMLTVIMMRHGAFERFNFGGLWIDGCAYCTFAFSKHHGYSWRNFDRKNLNPEVDTPVTLAGGDII